MQLGSIEVDVVDGYVVAARDAGGRRWAAGRRSAVPRLLSHVVVMGALGVPLVATAASAHTAGVPGRAAARMSMLVPAQELATEREHRAVALLATGDAVIAPAGPALPAPSPRPFGDRQPDPGGGGHFPWGWCTWYVSTLRFVPWMGNAIEWFANAARMGFPEGQAPRAGAIMVTRESPYGHVAYVESVDSDGNGWTVSEMNFRGFGVVDTRHIRAGAVPLVGFIY